jgi:DNA-binding CsgD family transcriptional regulator
MKAAGMKNREIAAALGISTQAVYKHTKKIAAETRKAS